MKLSILSLLLMSTSALADDIPWYTVEVLIFERTNATAGETELWPYDPGFPDLINTVQLTEPPPEAETPRMATPELESEPAQPKLLHPYQRLSGQELTLVPARKVLERSAAYEPLLHVAWRQLGLDSVESRPVHIRTSPYPLPLPQQRSATNVPPPATGRPALSTDAEPNRTTVEAVSEYPTQAVSELLAAGPSVEGALRLYRSRYLHFEADLLYFRPRPEGSEEEVFLDEEVYLSPPEIVPTHFRLVESRRMRSRELHYLDHPLFGLLVKVIPYEAPVDDEQDGTDNAASAPSADAETSASR